MIVILEGPDNAGKSTLANKLKADLNLEVVHPGGPPKNIADAIARCVEQSAVFSMSAEVNFIYDRVTCISDMIYRGVPEYHRVFKKFQAQFCRSMNVVIIICRPSNERLRNFDDHVTKEHETEEVVQHAKDNVDRIISEYDAVIDDFSSDRYIDCIIYDFEHDSDGEEYKILKSFIYNRLDPV